MIAVVFFVKILPLRRNGMLFVVKYTDYFRQKED